MGIKFTIKDQKSVDRERAEGLKHLLELLYQRRLEKKTMTGFRIKNDRYNFKKESGQKYFTFAWRTEPYLNLNYLFTLNNLELVSSEKKTEWISYRLYFSEKGTELQDLIKEVERLLSPHESIESSYNIFFSRLEDKLESYLREVDEDYFFKTLRQMKEASDLMSKYVDRLSEKYQEVSSGKRI